MTTVWGAGERILHSHMPAYLSPAMHRMPEGGRETPPMTPRLLGSPSY